MAKAKAKPEWQRLIARCQKLWEAYDKAPTKKRLEAFGAHLEKMKASKSIKVKAERTRGARAFKQQWKAAGYHTPAKKKATKKKASKKSGWKKVPHEEFPKHIWSPKKGVMYTVKRMYGSMFGDEHEYVYSVTRKGPRVESRVHDPGVDAKHINTLTAAKAFAVNDFAKREVTKKVPWSARDIKGMQEFHDRKMGAKKEGAKRKANPAVHYPEGWKPSLGRKWAKAASRDEIEARLEQVRAELADESMEFSMYRVHLMGDETVLEEALKRFPHPSRREPKAVSGEFEANPKKKAAKRKAAKKRATKKKATKSRGKIKWSRSDGEFSSQEFSLGGKWKFELVAAKAARGKYRLIGGVRHGQDYLDADYAYWKTDGYPIKKVKEDAQKMLDAGVYTRVAKPKKGYAPYKFLPEDFFNEKDRFSESGPTDNPNPKRKVKRNPVHHSPRHETEIRVLDEAGWHVILEPSSIEGPDESGIKAVKLVDPDNEDYYALITRSARDPGQWQATRFDERGPVGHSTKDTLIEAVNDTRKWYGLTVSQVVG